MFQESVRGQFVFFPPPTVRVLLSFSALTGSESFRVPSECFRVGPSEWVLPSPSESFRVVLLLLFATLPPTHPWFPPGSRSPTRKDSEGQDSEGLGGTRKDSEGLGGTRKDSEGLGRIRKDPEGLGGNWKDLEGLGRIGKVSNSPRARPCGGFLSRGLYISMTLVRPS